MRINTRAVWQMIDTGYVLLERDSYEYDGPCAAAFGGDSDTSTSSSTETNTQNLNLQGIEGVGIAGVRGGRVNVETTDHGTVEAARDVAIAALDTGATGFNEATNLAGDAIATSERLTGDVLNFADAAGARSADIASDALATGERLTGDVLGFAAGAQQEVFDVVTDSQADAYDFARENAAGFRESSSELIGRFIAGAEGFFESALNAVTGANDQVLDATREIQARESVNTDARFENVTKFALIGAAVLGLGAIWAASR